MEEPSRVTASRLAYRECSADVSDEDNHGHDDHGTACRRHGSRLRLRIRCAASLQASPALEEPSPAGRGLVRKDVNMHPA